jgi:hypothetical protein
MLACCVCCVLCEKVEVRVVSREGASEGRL